MSIEFMCPCGRRFEFNDGTAGLRIPCPECGYELTVPGGDPRSEVVFIDDSAGPGTISGRATGSLVLGLFFILGGWTGVPAILLGCEALRRINRSGGRLRGRGLAVTGIALGTIGCLVALIAVDQHSPDSGRRAQCTNNLKQIGLAMHNYHEKFGCFPASAIAEKQGKPLLSWRVALLPYLEASSTYAKFHLDEPWDSPHNSTLLDQMPGTYACPSDRRLKPGMTGYEVIIGTQTAFTPDNKPLSIPAFTDGLSQTIFVAESRRSVPWTKPEDIDFDMAAGKVDLGSVDGRHNNGFNVLMGDGAVRFLKDSTPPVTLRMLLTRNGGESIREQ
jgi:prepilin-type processing-associated H-X9-DG protein